MFSRSGSKYEPESYSSRKWFRRLKKLLLFSGAVLLLLTVIFFVFRNDMLHWAIGKVKHSVFQKYHATLSIGEASFSGLTSVNLQQISLKPNEGDTLLNAAKVDVSVRIFPLLIGKIRISSLRMDQAHLHLMRYDSTHTNFAAFIKKEQPADTSEKKDINIGKVAYKAISKLMAMVPSDVECRQTGIEFNNIGNIYGFEFKEARLDDEKIYAGLQWITPQDTENWQVNGTFSPSDMTGQVSLRSTERDKIYIPLIEEKYKLKLGAQEVELKLNEVDYSDDELSVKCYAAYKNLLVNHKRLSDSDVTVPSGSGDFNLLVGENYIALDSSSRITINKFSFHPYIRYQHAPYKVYTLKLNAPKTLAQDFFNSLPDGMFESLSGIRTEGYLSYRMQAELCDTSPWDCSFDSELIPENFKVTSWGAAYLPKLNGSFVYTPFEYGRPQRPIEVSDGSPDFTPIDAISPYLRNAILTSEDPSFYGHRGFVMESIRQSIAQNYATKKFARGASTISMQLVKNIFLSRKKTLTRKFEEMLLVWMIENLHVTGKQRIFEVYLNIIEWGPGVYGAGEASHFYFRKPPSDLTLAEAIFMASIIPRPKGFMWNFNDSTGTIKPHLDKYMRNITRLMAGRKLLTEEDTAMFNPSIRLSGNAAGMLRKNKNTPQDSVMEEAPVNPEEWDQLFPDLHGENK